MNQFNELKLQEISYLLRTSYVVKRKIKIDGTQNITFVCLNQIIYTY